MDASKLLERAMQASERGNHDYAVELFQQLLTVQPDHVKARTELRAVERRRVQENGGMNIGVKALAAIKGLVPAVKASVFSLTKGHERRMIECEKYLQNDPENRLMLSLLARSAERINYLDTAVLVYEDVKDKYPKDIGCIRRLARLYQKRGNIDDASECFQRILNAKPRDEEAERAVKDLAALKTMKEGRWTEAGSKGDFRKMLKDSNKSEELEQDQHIARTDEDLQARIEKVKADVEVDPRNTKILMQLADLYIRANSREQARSVLKQVKQIDPRNLVVDRRLSELDVADKQELVDGLKQKLAQSPNDEPLKQQLERGTAELREFQIKQLEAWSRPRRPISGSNTSWDTRSTRTTTSPAPSPSSSIRRATRSPGGTPTGCSAPASCARRCTTWPSISSTRPWRRRPACRAKARISSTTSACATRPRT